MPLRGQGSSRRWRVDGACRLARVTLTTEDAIWLEAKAERLGVAKARLLALLVRLARRARVSDEQWTWLANREGLENEALHGDGEHCTGVDARNVEA